MKNIFYCYRCECDRSWNLYTPAYRLAGAYPEWTETGLATLNDEKIQTNVVMCRRVGWLSVDDTIESDVTSEISTFGISSMLQLMTEEQVEIYLDTYTDYEKVNADIWYNYILQEADVELWIEEEILHLSVSNL